VCGDVVSIICPYIIFDKQRYNDSKSVASAKECSLDWHFTSHIANTSRSAIYNDNDKNTCNASLNLLFK